jgi:hypothetical protein
VPNDDTVSACPFGIIEADIGLTIQFLKIDFALADRYADAD